MLAQRLRRWSNTVPTLAERLVFAMISGIIICNFNIVYFAETKTHEDTAIAMQLCLTYLYYYIG